MIELAAPPAIIRPAPDLWLPKRQFVVPKKNIVPGFMPMVAPSGGLITRTLGGSGLGTPGAALTFSNFAIGAANAGRLVVACIAAFSGNTGVTLSSVTIGGIAATINVQETTAGTGGDTIMSIIATAAVPTGTTATVVVNFSASMSGNAVVYSMTGASGVAALDTVTDEVGTPLNGTLDVVAGGVVIANLHNIGVGSFPVTWTVVTKDYESNYASNNFNQSTASLLVGSTGTATPNVTMPVNPSTASVLAAASWAPA